MSGLNENSLNDTFDSKEENLIICEFSLPDEFEKIASICGHLESHLRLIEDRLMVEISYRGANFKVVGELALTAQKVIESLYHHADDAITLEIVHLTLQEYSAELSEKFSKELNDNKPFYIKTKRKLIKGRGENQQIYLENIIKHYDVNFGIGPAGTGKTYLAVAAAVDALEREKVRRIILVRPAVEAGEKLGFLPGDLTQKVDPYLRPLYDALYDMLGFELVGKYIERNVIEIAPLAFMRGRTLNDAFILLDEAQNTTIEQMKMFLTRIGFGSKAIITGDPSQVDLPKHIPSGLVHAVGALNGVKGIGFTHFNAQDVVRHPMVQRIVIAYEKALQAEKDARNQYKLE